MLELGERTMAIRSHDFHWRLDSSLRSLLGLFLVDPTP